MSDSSALGLHFCNFAGRTRGIYDLHHAKLPYPYPLMACRTLARSRTHGLRVATIAALRWSYDKDPERAARANEKDLHTLADKISKYGREMQGKYPTGSVVVSEEDLAGALHRAPEKVIRALRLLHTQQRVEPAPLIGYWKLNIESD